jgi:uncharacterized protein (TIGR03083 family)
MDNDAFVDAYVRAAEGIAAAARRVGLDAAIPACPNWTMADLVAHVTQIHFRWIVSIAERQTSPDQIRRPDRPTDDELLETFDTGRAQLADILRTTDPSTEVWTWTDDHTVGFVSRRMAHEMAVHRWDADSAEGEPAPIEPELASDGIDEFLSNFAPRLKADAEPVGGSVHIHCGDTPGEWTIRPGQDGRAYAVAREHAKGDCALRGPANDILLVLWRRRGLDTIDVVGDADVARRFVAAAAL